jgi:hypothetical protein
LTIVRDIGWPPLWVQPEPPTPAEPLPLPNSVALEYFDVWTDLKEGDDWSRVRFPVCALDRPLKGPDGTKRLCFVALWYKHGIPVSGAIYNKNGHISASFVANGVEHTDKIGSLQVLTYNQLSAGFKLSWQPYKVRPLPFPARA